VERGEGVGEDDVTAGSLLICAAGVGPAAPVLPEEVAWPAVELALSIPFAAQLTAVSSPAATARTVIRRRQYVACETFAGWLRAPRTCAGLSCRFWSTLVSMGENHRK
jgi:hypothetical protein